MLRVDYDELEGNEDHTLTMYDGKFFTGIAYELWPNGQLRDEVSFVDGAKDGISRSWSESGNLVSENSFFMNRVHGFLREWYESGQLKSEQKAELGIFLSHREWLEDGELVREEVLKEGAPDMNHLRALRKQFAPRLAERNMPGILP
jgi:antitoxin component YwqK of YwqJK toxin-antitoxin module